MTYKQLQVFITVFLYCEVAIHLDFQFVIMLKMLMCEINGVVASFKMRLIL